MPPPGRRRLFSPPLSPIPSSNTPCFKLLDLSRLVAQLRKNFIYVPSKGEGCGADASRGVAEFDGDADGLGGFSVAVLGVHHHLSLVEQPAVHGLGKGFYRAPAEVEAGESIGPVGQGFGFDEVAHGLGDLVAFVVVKLEGFEAFQAGGLTEGGPELGF